MSVEREIGTLTQILKAESFNRQKELDATMEKVDILLETLQEKISNRMHHILLHEPIRSVNGMYKLKTFFLDTNRITHVEEVTSMAHISIDDIVNKHKSKLDPSTLGEYCSRIRTDLLDKNDKPEVFYAMESVEYIHSQM